MRSLVFVLGVLLACIGFSSISPLPPEGAADPGAAVPVLEQQTDTPSPTAESEPAEDDPKEDPEADADDEEQDEGRKKMVLALVALGLLIAVYWGRRIRKNRSQQPTVS